MSKLNDSISRYLGQVAEGEPEVIVVSRRLTPSNDTLNRSELDILAEAASGCTQCALAESRQNVVFGTGDPNADLMFIGEAPGADEDRLGEPFVGRAGKLLDRIIVAMEMERRNVYIANILKCRPPGNRNPNPEEAAACLPYLKRQIELVDPKVIVALGLVAATRLLDAAPNTTLKSLRGRIMNFADKPFVVTYHPAALLRNQSFKAPTWEDMQMVMKILSGEISGHPAAAELFQLS